MSGKQWLDLALTIAIAIAAAATTIFILVPAARQAEGAVDPRLRFLGSLIFFAALYGWIATPLERLARWLSKNLF